MSSAKVAGFSSQPLWPFWSADGRIPPMTTRPDRASFYADVLAAGSLAAVLQATADADGISIPVAVSEPDPLYYATVASKVPHRNNLAIGAYAWKRWWSIRGEESFQGMELIDGNTDDLAQIVRAAQAWHEGAAPAEIRHVAPFVHLSGRFDVPDNDPAQLTESEWQYLRTKAAETDRPEFRALVEAAYGEPALRALYPFFSHGTLQFSTHTRPGITGLALFLIAESGGHYTLSDNLFESDNLGEAVTAEELASMAARHLPAGLEPVALGTVADSDPDPDCGF